MPIPFHFLSNIQMNMKPKNYSWPQFYDLLIDVTKYSYSPRLMLRRFMANGETLPRWLNVVRGLSSERFGRVAYFTEIRQRLETDRPLRRFFEQETDVIPQYFIDKIRRDLGHFWEWLPKGAISHNPNAYVESAELTASSEPIRRARYA